MTDVEKFLYNEKIRKKKMRLLRKMKRNHAQCGRLIQLSQAILDTLPENLETPWQKFKGKLVQKIQSYIMSTKAKEFRALSERFDSLKWAEDL